MTKITRLTPKQEASSDQTTPERLAALSQLEDISIQRVVAKNPKTPPETLEYLSHSRDKATRRAVAGNPNTPSGIMTELGGQFPMELLNNPALDIMFLENPNIFSEMPQSTLRSLAKRENCSSGLLGHLAKVRENAGLLLSLMQNPNTPREAIKKFSDVIGVEACGGISEAYEVPESEMEVIADAARMHIAITPEPEFSDAQTILWDEVKKIRLGKPVDCLLLKAARLPEAVRMEIISNAILYPGSQVSHLTIVRRINLPLPLLEVIACIDKSTYWGSYWDTELRKKEKKILLGAISKLPEVPVWLIGHRTLLQTIDSVRENGQESLDQLTNLLECDSAAMQLLLATNHPLAPRVPSLVDLLNPLAKCEDVESRCIVAESPNTSHHLLESLINDSEVEVRKRTAKNPSVSTGLLEVLANDTDLKVVYLVAINPAASPKFRIKVLESIVARLRKNWESCDNWHDYDLVRKVARHPDSNEWILQTIADRLKRPILVCSRVFDSMEVRESIAQHPNAPDSVLEYLSDDESVSVRKYVAEHPNLPLPILKKLAQEKETMPGAARNPNLPIELLMEMAKNRNIFVKYAVSMNPSTPEDIRVEMFRNLAEDVRGFYRNEAKKALKKRGIVL